MSDDAHVPAAPAVPPLPQTTLRGRAEPMVLGGGERGDATPEFLSALSEQQLAVHRLALHRSGAANQARLVERVKAQWLAANAAKRTPRAPEDCAVFLIAIFYPLVAPEDAPEPEVDVPLIPRSRFQGGDPNRVVDPERAMLVDAMDREVLRDYLAKHDAYVGRRIHTAAIRDLDRPAPLGHYNLVVAVQGITTESHPWDKPTGVV